MIFFTPTKLIIIGQLLKMYLLLAMVNILTIPVNLVAIVYNYFTGFKYFGNCLFTKLDIVERTISMIASVGVLTALLRGGISLAVTVLGVWTLTSTGLTVLQEGLDW